MRRLCLGDIVKIVAVPRSGQIFGKDQHGIVYEGDDISGDQELPLWWRILLADYTSVWVKRENLLHIEDEINENAGGNHLFKIL